MVMGMALMVSGGERGLVLRFMKPRGFRLEERNQIQRILLAEAKDRHAYRGKLRHQRGRGRIVQCSKLRGIADEAGEPGAVSTLRDSAQVGSNPVSGANGVTRSTYLLEQGLPGLFAHGKA